MFLFLTVDYGYLFMPLMLIFSLFFGYYFGDHTTIFGKKHSFKNIVQAVFSWTLG